MRELSLFTGAGGGLLASKLLGWRTVGYVEWDAYAQAIIRQRIADGHLDAATVFGDVRAFARDGYARAYRGMVDVVSGGFPCHPFSVAGSRKGADDERNMWPAVVAVLGEVRPRFAFLENVPGLLTVADRGRPYTHRVFGDLAELGYDCRWGIVGADDAGAPHRRKRLWIVARRVGHAEQPSAHAHAERG